MSPELPDALHVALQVIDSFESLGIRYHVGGSYASSVHGIPRQTQDIDLVADLTPEAAAHLARRHSGEFYVDAEGAREAAREGRSFNLIHLDSGLKVDIFVLGSTPFDQEEFRRHVHIPAHVDPARLVCVKSAEDTILRKLQWYRLGGETSDRQWRDVAGIVQTQGDRLDRKYLQRWARELGLGDLLDRVLGPNA